MKVSLAPGAEQDLVEGGLYYSREASEDLGRALISEFERSAALLAEQPHLGAPWRGQVRRFPLRRFPYSIVYYLGQAEVRILAVAHQSRKPGFWRGRT
ncbi:MAG: type II toxin-antitoxin system RelE/ParE family toxin [Acidimicrobiales bacterium]